MADGDQNTTVLNEIRPLFLAVALVASTASRQLGA